MNLILSILSHAYTFNSFLGNLNLHLFTYFIFRILNSFIELYLNPSIFLIQIFPFLIYSLVTYPLTRIRKKIKDCFSKKRRVLLPSKKLGASSRERLKDGGGGRGGGVKRLELRNCSRKYALPVPGVSTAFRQGNERARD